MRIALFHNLPSGGAKRTLNELARRLAAGHWLDVFTLASADHAFADLRPYVARHISFDFKPLPLFGSPFGRLNQGLRLVDLLRLQALSRVVGQQILAGGYDLLFVHPCQFEKGPTLLRHVGALPSLYYCQEPLRRLYERMPERPYDDDRSQRRRMLNRVDPLLRLYDALLKRVDRENTRSASRVLVNSNFSREMVRRAYGVEARVSYLGVDTAWFRPLSIPKQWMLLSVGSLTPLKGFDFLIEAVATLPAGERPPLVIVSNFQDGPERGYLERLAEERQVRLHLLANVSDEQLVKLYNRALVTLYAPIREPFGLVPLESLACETPVVGVREGGVQESVLHEQTGLLVDRDPVAFGLAVRRLLADARLARGLGRNGREQVLQEWTWERSVARLEEEFGGYVRARVPVTVG